MPKHLRVRFPCAGCAATPAAADSRERRRAVLSLYKCSGRRKLSAGSRLSPTLNPRERTPTVMNPSVEANARSRRGVDIVSGRYRQGC
jgi:hypothetical protein